MKKNLIILGILFLLICVGLSGCQEHGIHIEKLNVKPDNFINMTEEQMKHFPHLKEAIITNKTIDIYDDEDARLMGIFDYFDTNYICYKNEYYEIKIWCAD
jgi:hypothetical protein